MTDEAKEDTESLYEFGKRFDATHIGNIVHETAIEVKTHIDELMISTQNLLPYLINLHCTDHQRQIAEQEMRRLSALLDMHMKQYQNILRSAQALQYPIVVFHT